MSCTTCRAVSLREASQAVQKMVMINPQGFIDGAPKVGPLGPLGIKVLGSWPLRWMANQMAYFNKARSALVLVTGSTTQRTTMDHHRPPWLCFAQQRYATDDAVRVGRLHVDTDGWEEAQMVSGS
eukprot:Skav224529  [mRNA]  locus=scaffold388:494507:496319:+ [translate_table: standard]